LSATLKKVSVIVPNYNYSKYIKSRLESIEIQTYPIYELIFLDDASTDESLKELRTFQEKSQLKIQVVINHKNSGSVFKQWLKGIELAKGDYIWIAEADDLSEPTFLESVMKGFDDKEVILSYSLSKIIDSKNKIIHKHYLHATDDIDQKRWLHDYIRQGKDEITDTFVIKNTIPNVSSAVFKKIDLSSISEKLCMFKVAGDWYLYYHLLKQGKIAYCASPLNLYRRHSHSVSSSTKNNPKHYEELILMQHLIYKHFPVTNNSWEIALKHRSKMKKWLKIYQKNIKKYLFIITYGESGVEKLMTTLNDLEYINIKGENMGVLSHLYQAYKELLKAKEHAGENTKNPIDPWYGIQEVNPYLFSIENCTSFVQQVLQPSPEIKITGFKEIRFLNKSHTWMDHYIYFLFEFFPNSAIIFYHADIEKVAQTGFWKQEDTQTLLPKLHSFDRWMRNCHLKYPERTFQLEDKAFSDNPFYQKKLKDFIETELL